MAPSTKATQKRLDAAFAAFNARYANSNQWGSERWYQSLYPSLAQPTTYCAVVNHYAITDSECKDMLCNASSLSLNKIEFPVIDKQESSTGDSIHISDITCYEKSQTGTPQNDSSTLPIESTSKAPFVAPRSVPSSDRPLFSHWILDAASALSAQLLEVHPGDRVLDMCAAPGGKSVVLAQKLFPHLHKSQQSTLPNPDILDRSCLHTNEIDHVRYKRLNSNLMSYLPQSLFPTPENPQGAVRVFNKDLSTKSAVQSLPYGEGGYDKVLVDAPCSSERHIIHAYLKALSSGKIADEMSNWKSSHVTTLVKTQSGLLHAALKAVRIGGTVIYATCALGTEENDGVVEKVLDTLKAERKRAKRDSQPVENWTIKFEYGTKDGEMDNVDPILQRMTESTQYGRIALPDHGGWGPLYFCRMTKIEKTKTAKKVAKPDELQNDLA